MFLFESSSYLCCFVPNNSFLLFRFSVKCHLPVTRFFPSAISTSSYSSFFSKDSFSAFIARYHSGEESASSMILVTLDQHNHFGMRAFQYHLTQSNLNREICCCLFLGYLLGGLTIRPYLVVVCTVELCGCIRVILSSDLLVTKVFGFPPESPFCNSLTSFIKFASATDSAFCNSFSLPFPLNSKKNSQSLSLFTKCVFPGKLVSLKLTFGYFS